MRSSYFDNIMTPETQMEGNVVAANGEYVAVSFQIFNVSSRCHGK